MNSSSEAKVELELILTYADQAAVHKIGKNDPWHKVKKEICVIFSLETLIYAQFKTKKGIFHTIVYEGDFSRFKDARHACHRLFIYGTTFPLSNSSPIANFCPESTKKQDDESEKNKQSSKRPVDSSFVAEVLAASDEALNVPLDGSPFAKAKALQDFIEILKPYESIFAFQPHLQYLIFLFSEQLLNGASIKTNVLLQGLEKLIGYDTKDVPFQGFNNPFLYNTPFLDYLANMSFEKKIDRFFERLKLSCSSYINHLPGDHKPAASRGSSCFPKKPFNLKLPTYRKILFLYHPDRPKQSSFIRNDTCSSSTNSRSYDFKKSSLDSIEKIFKTICSLNQSHLPKKRNLLLDIKKDQGVPLSDFVLQSSTFEALVQSNNELSRILAHN